MAKSSKNRKQHNVLYLIAGALLLAFGILSGISAVKATYDKVTVEEVVRTYDKKRTGSTRKYYADVVVSYEKNGEKITANTTVRKSSKKNLPGVGDTIDVQINTDGSVIASSRVNSILVSVVGVLAGALLIWFSISNMIESKKKKEESGAAP